VVTDLAGASSDSLIAELGKQVDATRLLVAPAYAVSSLDLPPSCVLPVEGSLRGLHVDMDGLDEVWKGGWSQAGVGVWKVGQCPSPQDGGDG
jgi:hypothetical protein